MVKNLSFVEKANEVTFPEYKGERIYMLPVTLKDGLPQALNHWQPTVDALMDGIDIEKDSPFYLMIDQKFVPKGQMHRRAGIHVDGYWIPGIFAHGNPGGGGTHNQPSEPDRHSQPRRTHHTPSVPSKPDHHSQPRRTHNTPSYPDDSPGFCLDTSKDYLIWEPEALVLASNVQACRAWEGIYTGEPVDGGDCTHIDLTGLNELTLLPNTAYRGNVTMLHESLPVPEDCYRTLVRINVPGWSPEMR